MTMASLVLNDCCGLEHNALERYVLRKRSAGASRGGGDLVHDVHSLNDLSEYRIAVALLRCVLEIEELVVRDIDEELRGRGMRVSGARHRHRAGHIEQSSLAALFGLVLDGRARRLLLEIRSEPPSLNHESRNHAVKLSVVVLLGLDVGEKVFDRFRRGVRIQLDSDLAGGGIEIDLGIGCTNVSGCQEESGGEQQRDATYHGRLLCVIKIADGSSDGARAHLAPRYFLGLDVGAGLGVGTARTGALLEGGTAYSSRTNTSLAWALLLVLSITTARSYSAPARRL